MTLLIAPSGPPFDAKVIAETARIHERAGFDRVLIGYFSDAPDGFLVGAHAASVTERLSFLLAHRPGFMAPPVAARKLATLDQLSDGRLAVHIIAGGSDADQAKDGDWTDHEARYRRAAEYMSLLRRTWTEPAPFDHAGEFYRTRGTFSEIRCRQQPNIPIYGGGGSEAAIRALAPHVDVFVPLYNLMEDAATAEISRAHIWQWIPHRARLSSSAKLIEAPAFPEFVSGARRRGGPAQARPKRKQGPISSLIRPPDFPRTGLYGAGEGR